MPQGLAAPEGSPFAYIAMMEVSSCMRGTKARAVWQAKRLVNFPESRRYSRCAKATDRHRPKWQVGRLCVPIPRIHGCCPIGG